MDERMNQDGFIYKLRGEVARVLVVMTAILGNQHVIICIEARLKDGKYEIV